MSADHNKLRMKFLMICFCCAIAFGSSIGANAWPPEYLRFSANGKFGVRSADGRTIIPAEYDAIGWSDGSFTVAEGLTGFKSASKWGLINLNQQIIVAAEFSRLNALEDNKGRTLLIATRTSGINAGKTGVLDSRINERIPFIYDDIRITGDRAVLVQRRGTRLHFGMSDLNHQILISADWTFIQPAGNTLFAVRNTQHKTALFSRDGERITEFLFDSIGMPAAKLIPVYSGNYTGVAGIAGKIIRYPAYRNATTQADGSMKLTRYDKWIALNRNLEEIRSIEADSIVPFERNFLRIVRRTKVGLVTTMLKEWWPLDYDLIHAGNGSVWITGKAGKLGITRADGQVLAEPIYDSIVSQAGISMVIKGHGRYQQWQVINLNTGKTTGNTFDRMELFQTFFKVRKKGFEGISDLQGNILAEPVYDSVLQITGQAAVVRFLGKYGIIDMKGTWLLLPQDIRPELIGDKLYTIRRENQFQIFTLGGTLTLSAPNPLKVVDDKIEEVRNGSVINRFNLAGKPIPNENRSSRTEKYPDKIQASEPTFPISEGLQGFRGDGKYGFRDTQGILRIPNRYDSVVPFSEGLAAVKLNGRWGFLDAEDRLVFQPRFDLPSRFRSGAAPVRLQGKYGILGKEGFRLQPEYDDLTPTPDGRYFILKKDGKYGLAEAGGTLLLEARYEYLKPVGKDQVIVRDGLFGVVNSRGMAVLPIAYEELWFLPEMEVFIGRQKGKEEMLTIRD